MIGKWKNLGINNRWPVFLKYLELKGRFRSILINKGPGRPYFNDQIRSRWLASLSCIDYVIVVPHAAAVEAIECVRPHFYCKGKEYENQESDVTGNIRDDVEAVKRVGGEMCYVGSIVFSSTKLLVSNPAGPSMIRGGHFTFQTWRLERRCLTMFRALTVKWDLLRFLPPT